MGKRGPAPTPTSLKKLRGNPGKRALPKDEPKPSTEHVPCPAFLTSGAKGEWKRIVPELKRLGLLTKVDRSALAAYCQHWDEFRRATIEIEAAGAVVQEGDKNPIVSPWITIRNRASELMNKYIQQFGFSPSSRVGLSSVEKVKEEGVKEFLYGD